MSSIIHHNIQTRIYVPARKFVSSLAANIQDSSNLHGVRSADLTPFEPFHFFNDYTRSRMCTRPNAKIIHAHLLTSATLHSHVFIANSLLDWYCKSSAMDVALHLFDEIADPNVITWNIMISGYTQNFLFEDSWRMFCRMRSLEFFPSQFTYGSVLSACAALRPILGQFIYSLAIKNGMFSNGYVRAGMIDLLAKNSCFEDALRVFQDVSCENVVCWNAIISGAVKNGENQVAYDIFHQMCCKPLVPNSFTFSSIMTACAALGELQMGKGVQGWVIKFGAGEDVFVGTAVVDFYAKCREMDEAVKEFSRMPTRNVVSWTAIISGFAQKDDSASALQFFKEMRKVEVEINRYTATSVLAACTKPTMGREATQVHSWTLKTGFCLDPVIGASLMNMYSKLGAIVSSEKVFGEMKGFTDLNACSVMISAFAWSENPGRAIELFQRMIQGGMRPDQFCNSSILSIIESLYLGRQVHCYNIKTGLVFDVSVGSSLSTMYSKCGSLEESYEVFTQILDKDNVSWSSMITGLSENGYTDKAIWLFREMLLEEIKPDQMSFNALLTACSAHSSLDKGKEVHGHAVRAGFGNELLIGSALVNMYSKCGSLKSARSMFDVMLEKDHVSCCSLVSGYARNGYIEEALLVFQDMLRAGLWIDTFTVSSVIEAVSKFNSSDIGFQLHACVTKLGQVSEVSVGTSLIMMYSKCGSIEDCRLVFDQIKEPDLISWTAMIVCYAQHGKGVDALRLYEIMQKNGVKPDSITFVGILSACSHSGLLEEGFYHLNSMTKDYGIKPENRHYACMVDLIGRSGKLEEAERFINDMPIEPDALVWGTLLAACKVHGNVELGKLAAEKAIQLKPRDAGAYVSLSNICAEIGQWELVLEIRSQMKGTMAIKEPGWSFV